MNNIDIAVIGGGINGSSTALHLAKSGLKVCVIDKDSICRGASGVNAGTLTMHMTRAKLIPFAKKGWELWMNTEKWLSNNIDVKKKNGLCLAFTEEEEKLLSLQVNYFNTKNQKKLMMGSMRTLLVSPFPRSFLLVSKLVAGVSVSILQVFAFLIIATLLFKF